MLTHFDVKKLVHDNFNGLLDIYSYVLYALCRKDFLHSGEELMLA